MAAIAPRYQAAVGASLRKYGLRYDDLFDHDADLDTNEALRRLPTATVDARNQRLKRALDISLKHTELPKEVQAQQTPFAFYLQDMLAQVKAENEERAALGANRPYDRQLP